jgi:hypothetical protein
LEIHSISVQLKIFINIIIIKYWYFDRNQTEYENSILSSHNKLIIFSRDDNNITNIINNSIWKGQRAIGVVYNPQYEKYGNYVPTNLSSRYDAFYLSMRLMP